MATILTAGMLIQNLRLALPASSSPSPAHERLNTYPLSAVPILILIQGIPQSPRFPLLAFERQQYAMVATVIGRTIYAISTVKVYNTEPHGRPHVDAAFYRFNRAAGEVSALWGITSALGTVRYDGDVRSRILFRLKLVREGEISAEDVMTVFWACLIATSNVQMFKRSFPSLSFSPMGNS